jgi:cytochrome c-type biogenesis protein CcmF
MASLGTFLILAAFVTASGACAACLAGARRQNRSLIDGGIGLMHVVTAMMLAASAIIVHAFVTEDYRIKYVQHYSDEVQPMFFKLASYWGGLDGSIMFWVTLLSIFGSVAVYINRERYRLLIPWVVSVISVVEMFFLFLMVVHNNPFETFLTSAPTTGQGLNPLLQNYYMAIHPPMLYLGFVGMTIPFAFGMAALATGQLDDSWLRAVRRWTMLAWLLLTVGLTLGALWAYETLGWGGYWAWDPVENAGLLPWFTATAFLHSVIVQERRSMLKVWNVSLVIVTFFLTIFGTFMTRSGVVQSVHAFGEDRQLAWMFTVFMIVTLVGSFALVIYRLPLLRARNELDSWVSREAAFLANNWVLLFAAFFVLFATMFPTLSEAIRGERLTVASDFFNKWMTPVGLVLLFLTGVGPLLAWKKSTLHNLRLQFLWPTLSTIATGIATTALGIGFWSSGLCFGLCAFVTVTILQEFWRGTRVRQSATRTDAFTALVGLVARSRRRYGGYIVHVGIVLTFLGFAGNGSKQDVEITLKPGQVVTIGTFSVRYVSLSVSDDGQKQIVTAHEDVTSGGKHVADLYPGKSFFRNHESEPVSDVAMRRTMSGDLYLVLGGYNVTTQEAEFKMFINPLVNWIWLGVAVMIIGTVIALMPERAFSFAAARVPAGAATTVVVLLAVLVGGATTLRAQHIELPNTVIVPPKSPLEKEMQSRIICMCGTCGRKKVGECTCTEAAAMREEIARLTAQGKTRDEIIQYFIDEYGSQEVLSQPIDRGFNRLAWLFPYAAGFCGILVVTGTAVRWSHRAPPSAEPAPSTTDPALESRLDHELEDLD